MLNAIIMLVLNLLPESYEKPNRSGGDLVKYEWLCWPNATSILWMERYKDDNFLYLTVQHQHWVCNYPAEFETTYKFKHSFRYCKMFSTDFQYWAAFNNFYFRLLVAVGCEDENYESFHVGGLEDQYLYYYSVDEQDSFNYSFFQDQNFIKASSFGDTEYYSEISSDEFINYGDFIKNISSSSSNESSRIKNLSYEINYENDLSFKITHSNYSKDPSNQPSLRSHRYSFFLDSFYPRTPSYSDSSYFKHTWRSPNSSFCHNSTYSKIPDDVLYKKEALYYKEFHSITWKFYFMVDYYSRQPGGITLFDPTWNKWERKYFHLCEGPYNCKICVEAFGYGDFESPFWRKWKKFAKLDMIDRDPKKMFYLENLGLEDA